MNKIILQEQDVFARIPSRDPAGNKGTFGTLLNISGSYRMPGAAKLSAKAAQSVGTGLVMLATAESAMPFIAPSLWECVYVPLPDAFGIISGSSAGMIGEKINHAQAVMIGCGLGISDGSFAVLEYVTANAQRPLLIDADGLNLLSRNISLLKSRPGEVVLTPHLKEMSRLCGISVEEIKKDCFSIGAEFAQKYHAVLVLKDAKTHIFTPQGDIYENKTGNDGLAKAGSGDILSGMIGGFMAQGMTAQDSAACGVYLHGAAAVRCAARLSRTAMQPSDLYEDICQIFLEHQR